MRLYLSLLFVLHSSSIIFANKRPEDEVGIFSSHSSHYLPIYHAFGSEDKYSLRGHIVFKTAKVTAANLQNEARLSLEEVDKLKKLVEKDGFYFLRAPTKMTTNFNENEIQGDDEHYVSTFVPACYLYGSLLTETIKVAVDNMGNVIGLSILSPRHDCVVAQLKNLDEDDAAFNSTVLINQQTAGPVPDTQSFIKKIEHDKAEQAAGKGNDNKSFIAKYWMYIIPVVLVLMLGSQGEPPAEGE